MVGFALFCLLKTFFFGRKEKSSHIPHSVIMLILKLAKFRNSQDINYETIHLVIFFSTGRNLWPCSYVFINDKKTRYHKFCCLHSCFDLLNISSKFLSNMLAVASKRMIEKLTKYMWKSEIHSKAHSTPSY